MKERKEIMTKSTKKTSAITALITAIVIFATVVSIMISSSLAYFRAPFDKNGYHNMIIELIFDRLDDVLRELKRIEDGAEVNNELMDNIKLITGVIDTLYLKK